MIVHTLSCVVRRPTKDNRYSTLGLLLAIGEFLLVEELDVQKRTD